VVDDTQEEEVKVVKQEKERDPLEDTEEEDPNKDFVARNLIEVDRLYYTVLAIENDCSIVPHGSFRLTEKHEVARNVAFRGLNLD
jgi:radial spoke head protein 9